jgi:hypothetical protein
MQHIFHFMHILHLTYYLVQALLARIAAGLRVLVLLHDTPWHLCFSAEAPA